MSKELQKKDDAIQVVYAEIQQLIQAARDKVYQTANFEMVKAYWEIGKRIVEEEQQGKDRAEYGRYLIKELSQRLQAEFGKGFNEANLRRMRLFYQAYPIRSALRNELSWTHYRVLIHVENAEARQFYEKEAIQEHWSYRALERQIGTHYYERLRASQKKKAVIAEAKENTKELKMTPDDIIKSPYMLEFLNMNPDLKYLEKEVEQGLIDKLQDFLLELGKGFAFIARQKRISMEHTEYYIDLVFYNCLLKCYVLIDLKSGRLTSEDVGKMDTYIRVFEDKVRQKDDNPTIGLILCTKKDDAVVKYSMLNDNQQIFASKYMAYLPSEEELKREILREKQLIELEKQDRDDQSNSSRNE